MLDESVPTIRQVYNQLKSAYNQLNQVFIDLGVSDLAAGQDLQSKKISINQVLQKIPTEQRLDHILKHSTREDIRQKIMGYGGENELIRQARENFGEIKKQQQNMYYLAVKCELPSVSVEFKERNVENIRNLHSFRDVVEVKNTKMKTLEKNSLSKLYLEQGQAELDNKNEPIKKFSKKCPELKKLDLLIHVNFYDSHNSQKQYEFVCVQDQSLSSLQQKFKCLIDKLSKKQIINNRFENEREVYQLYDKFYQPPATSAKNLVNKLEITQSSGPGLRYFVIEDIIYYQGNRHQLEPLLNIALQKKPKTHYRCMQISKTKLADLRVIFGKPYLYRHLQGCDHIVIFKQARMFMGNDDYNHDILQIDKYPITVYESKMKRRKCEGCTDWFAEVVTIADPLKNGENLYLCGQCHRNLHLDEQGNNKYGDKLKFIPYIHD